MRYSPVSAFLSFCIQIVCASAALTSCGDISVDAEADVSGVSVSADPARSGSTREATASPEKISSPADTSVPACLTDCDNGIWKNLTATPVDTPDPMQIEGCTQTGASAFVRDNQMEILSIVDCSGLESLYLWSMSATGEVTRTPKKIASCPLDQTLSRLRRAAGKNGVLTSWSCTGNSYYSPTSYFVRVEDPTGALLYTKPLGSVSYSSSEKMQVAYNEKADVWGVAFSGLLYRFTSSGLLSGTTTWSTNSWTSIQSMVVRDGVFQIMEGYSFDSAKQCSRVTSGGALLCKSTSVAENVDSAVPISGSRHILIQSGEKMSIASDSEGSCSIDGVAQTLVRHSESRRILNAAMIPGTPYVAVLGKKSEQLVFDVLQLTPAMRHLTSIPLANQGEWSNTSLNMFEVGGHIIVSYGGSTSLRMVSIQLPESVRQESGK